MSKTFEALEYARREPKVIKVKEVTSTQSLDAPSPLKTPELGIEQQMIILYQVIDSLLLRGSMKTPKK
jgi:hypothetical protein